MAFSVIRPDGTREQDPPMQVATALRVGAIEHDSGWRLTRHADGGYELDHTKDPRVRVRHLDEISDPVAAAELAEAIAVGYFYATLDYPWRDGPRTLPTR